MQVTLYNDTSKLQLLSLHRRMRLPKVQIVYIALQRLYDDYEAGKVRLDKRQ